MPRRKECSECPTNGGQRARSNEQRKQYTSKAIEDKVAILEAVADRAHPFSEGLPLSMREFRDWVDPALGLVAIRSPSSTNEKLAKHNANLVGRAYTAMRAIAAMRKARKLRVYVPLGTQLDNTKKALEAAEEENRRLGSEVLRFKHLYDVTAERLKTVTADSEMHARDLNALRAEYLNATKSKPRRVK